MNRRVMDGRLACAAAIVGLWLVVAGAHAAGTEIRAGVLWVTAVGDDSLVVLDVGARHGVKKGMVGIIQGTKTSLLLVEVDTTRSKALVRDTAPRALAKRKTAVFRAD